MNSEIQLLTLQETFNRIAVHLLTQNKKSTTATSSEGVPSSFDTYLYLNNDGLKCAVGALIPDGQYNHRFDTRGPVDVQLSQRYYKWYKDGPSLDKALAAGGVDIDNEQVVDLLKDAQLLHDSVDPVETWPERLLQLAKQFGLDPDVVVNFKKIEVVA